METWNLSAPRFFWATVVGSKTCASGRLKAGRTPRHLQDIGHLALNLGRALLTDSEALAPWSGSARSKHIRVPRSSEPSGPLSKKRRRWPGSLKVDWTSTCSWHFKASMLAHSNGWPPRPNAEGLGPAFGSTRDESKTSAGLCAFFGLRLLSRRASMTLQRHPRLG